MFIGDLDETILVFPGPITRFLIGVFKFLPQLLLPQRLDQLTITPGKIDILFRLSLEPQLVERVGHTNPPSVTVRLPA